GTQADVRRSALTPEDLDAAPGDVASEPRPQGLRHSLLAGKPAGVVAGMHWRRGRLLALGGGAKTPPPPLCPRPQLFLDPHDPHHVDPKPDDSHGAPRIMNPAE